MQSKFLGLVTFLALSLTGLILPSCSSSKIVNASQLKLSQDFCAPAIDSTSHVPYTIYYNTDSLLKNEELMTRYLTKQDILTANATGTLELIRNMIRSLKDSSAETHVAYLEYNLRIQKKLENLRASVDAVSSELACESYRTRQISSYLNNLNSKKNTKLTVAAIAMGALVTILPIFVTEKTPQNIILIGGGITSAGLAALTLNPTGRRVNLMHYRNLLSEFWFGEKKENIYNYPPGIWYIMSEPAFGSAAQGSKATVTKMRWMKFDLENSIDSETVNLLFGDGGIYSAGDLDTRASMLSELVVVVSSIKQYLDHLNSDLQNITLQALHVNQ